MNSQTKEGNSAIYDYDYIDISAIEDADIRILSYEAFKDSTDNRLTVDVENKMKVFHPKAKIVGLKENSGSTPKVFYVRDNMQDFVLKVAAVNAHSLAEIKFLKRINAESEDRYAGKLVDACCFIEDGKPKVFFLLLKRYKEINYKSLSDEDSLYHFFVNVLMSLNYIHYIHNIKHLDIKEENIVSRDDERIILIDFDSSDPINYESEEKRGTDGYTAPERLMSGGETGYYSDLFSIGSLLFNRICGDSPSWGRVKTIGRIHDEKASIDRERKKIYNTLIECCNKQKISTDLANIIMKCIEYYPKDRYQTTAECLDSIYQHYKEIDVSEIYRDSYFINSGSELRWIYLDGKEPLILKAPKGIRYALNNSVYSEKNGTWSYSLPKKYLSKDRLEEVYRIAMCFDEIMRKDDKFMRAWKSGSCRKMDESFFEDKLIDIEISKIHEGDVFYKSKKNKEKRGEKGIVSYGDIISFFEDNDIYAIASSFYEGQEYVCARVAKDEHRLTDNYVIYRIIYENNGLEKVTSREQLLPVIMMLMKTVSSNPNYECYDEILVSCYFGEQYSKNKEVEMYRRALDTQQSTEIRSFATYRLGAAYLVGYGVDKDINRARRYLNESKEPQARRWKKRAYGFCASNCMLFGVLIVIELLGLELYRFLCERVLDNSFLGQLGFLIILFAGIKYSNWLMKKAIWDFNMPEALQLVPVSVFVLFYLLYIYSQTHILGGFLLSLSRYERLIVGVASAVVGVLISIVISKIKGIYIRWNESVDYSKRQNK